MISRRQFVQSSTAMSIATALPMATALAKDLSAVGDASLGDPQVVLFGLRDNAAAKLVRDRMACSASCSAAAVEKMQLYWAPHQNQCWDGGSLQIHTRYTPSFEGAALDKVITSVNTPLPALQGFARHNNAFTAIPLAIEPAAVLLNRSKLGSTRGSSSLSSLERAGFRPTFVLSDWHDTGASSWALPLLAHHLPLASAQGDGCAMFLSSATLSGLGELHKSFMRRIDLKVEPLHPGLDAYYRLIDPKASDAVALYGNPMILGELLKERGQGGLVGQFEEVSLSEFLGYELPALPRVQSLQLGTAVANHPIATDLARGLLDAVNGTAPQLFSGCDEFSCSTHRLSGNSYNLAHYNHIANLQHLTDGSFAARVLTMLHSHTAVERDTLLAATRAAGDAYFAWEEYLTGQELLGRYS